MLYIYVRLQMCTYIYTHIYICMYPVSSPVYLDFYLCKDLCRDGHTFKHGPDPASPSQSARVPVSNLVLGG